MAFDDGGGGGGGYAIMKLLHHENFGGCDWSEFGDDNPQQYGGTYRDDTWYYRGQSDDPSHPMLATPSASADYYLNPYFPTYPYKNRMNELPWVYAMDIDTADVDLSFTLRVRPSYSSNPSPDATGWAGAYLAGSFTGKYSVPNYASTLNYIFPDTHLMVRLERKGPIGQRWVLAHQSSPNEPETVLAVSEAMPFEVPADATAEFAQYAWADTPVPVRCVLKGGVLTVTSGTTPIFTRDVSGLGLTGRKFGVISDPASRSYGGWETKFSQILMTAPGHLQAWYPATSHKAAEPVVAPPADGSAGYFRPLTLPIEKASTGQWVNRPTGMDATAVQPVVRWDNINQVGDIAFYLQGDSVQRPGPAPHLNPASSFISTGTGNGWVWMYGGFGAMDGAQDPLKYGPTLLLRRNPTTGTALGVSLRQKGKDSFYSSRSTGEREYVVWRIAKDGTKTPLHQHTFTIDGTANPYLDHEMGNIGNQCGDGSVLVRMDGTTITVYAMIGNGRRSTVKPTALFDYELVGDKAEEFGERNTEHGWFLDEEYQQVFGFGMLSLAPMPMAFDAPNWVTPTEPKTENPQGSDGSTNTDGGGVVHGGGDGEITGGVNVVGGTSVTPWVKVTPKGGESTVVYGPTTTYPSGTPTTYTVIKSGNKITIIYGGQVIWTYVITDPVGSRIATSTTYVGYVDANGNAAPWPPGSSIVFDRYKITLSVSDSDRYILHAPTLREPMAATGMFRHYMQDVSLSVVVAADGTVSVKRYATADDEKTGRVYRGGYLNLLTPAEAAVLNDAGFGENLELVIGG